MGGKSGKARVADYYMSLHMGLCVAGEGLQLLGVRVGERQIWSGAFGNSRARANVHRPGLFGGNKKEGGVSGWLHWLPGGPTQVLPTGLSRRLGLNRRNAPAYRNIASVWFTGNRELDGSPALDGWDDWVPTGDGGSRKGWMWASNNPYLRPIWFRVRRPSLGLNPNKALWPVDPDDENSPQVSNPAHMIYECLTNRTWSRGVSPGAIDRASYEAAADTLYNEGLGLAAKWVRQSTIESFVNEVLDHINATQYLHPRTGKLTLKLLRADYDIADLRRITPSNARLIEYGRKLWGETANEIQVSWTNPANEGTETVTAQDLANIATQGAPVSSSRDYHMIRSAKMAAALAQREVLVTGQPLATATLEMDRSGWDVVPGEVVVLEDWDELGIAQLVCRVGERTEDGPGSSKLRFNVLEDIYGIPLGQFLSPPSAPPVDPEDPQPVETLHTMTAPAMLAAKSQGLNDPSELEYPDAVVTVLAAPRDYDVALQLWSDITLTSGNTTVGPIGTLDFAGTALLASPVLGRPSTVLPGLTGVTRGFAPADGDFLLFGTGADDETELAVVTGVTDGVVTLNRGVLDTVPRAWPTGTRIWRIPAEQVQYDPILRADGEEVTYRVLPQTTRGVLEYEDASDVDVTPSDRALLPLRPANVKVRGRGWSPVGTEDDTTVTVTWANRNRTLEATVALAWDAASSGGEASQTTTVTMLTTEGVVMNTYSGLTGTSLDIDIEDFGEEERVVIRVTSTRDSYDSLQGYEIEVYPGATFSYGYGGSYGVSYGG